MKLSLIRHMFSLALFQLKDQIELNIRTSIMYFIVYILQANQNVVVPYQWLELNRFLDWTINNGINSNITFDVFYTQNPDAFLDGIPRLDFVSIDSGVSFIYIVYDCIKYISMKSTTLDSINTSFNWCCLPNALYLIQ